MITRTKVDSDTDNDRSESGQSDEDNGASSSELDEEESERRKSMLLNDLTEIEKHFLNLREQLYIARKERVTTKLEEVKAGKAAEYLQPLEELQDQMRVRTEVAGILKELRMKNIRCQYDAEQYAAKQNFESEKQSIVNQIRADIEDKLRRLDEDRNSIDSDTLWSIPNDCVPSLLNRHAKNQRRRVNMSIEQFSGTRDHLFLPDRRRKPVSVTGPFIIYMLRDDEILEDHALIKRTLKPTSYE